MHAVEMTQRFESESRPATEASHRIEYEGTRERDERLLRQRKCAALVAQQRDLVLQQLPHRARGKDLLRVLLLLLLRFFCVRSIGLLQIKD